MFTFALDNNTKTTLYKQLYDFIKDEIVAGKIKADEKLPSKRNLAKNLGISILTVETAYSQLAAEGFIYSLPKKGYFVSYIKQTNHLSTMPVIEKKIIPEHPEDSAYINLSDNQTDPNTFPFSVWARILRELLSQNQSDVMKNSPSQGTTVLRNAIAKHLRNFRGMNINPEQIVIGAGTEYLYTLLIQLIGFDKTYAVEEPCHTKIIQIYNSFGVNNVQIPMDRNGIIINELNKNNADVVHISPSHHFPTGIVMPVTRRYELLGWASEKEGRFLIEDDYDSEFRFTGRPLPTLQSIDMAEKVIYMNTFTKTLSSTIRISYMVLPLPLLQIFRQKLNFYSCTVPVIDQYALAHFIDKGFFEKHINRMRKSYSIKRDAFIQAVSKYDTKKISSIIEGDSGLHFLLEIDSEQLDYFQHNLRKNGIKITAVSDYYKKPSNKDKNLFVINYSSIPIDSIEIAVRKLYSCIDT